jgi:hypothetical protein
MNRFSKDLLIVEEIDTQTVRELKTECNKLITKYNLLDEPLGETGQQLNFQINDLMMVIQKMRETHFKSRR